MKGEDPGNDGLTCVIFEYGYSSVGCRGNEGNSGQESRYDSDF